MNQTFEPKLEKSEKIWNGKWKINNNRCLNCVIQCRQVIVKFIYYIRKKCSKNHFWMAEWLRVDHLFKRLRFKSGNIHFFYLSHLIVLFSEHFSKNPNSTQYTKLNTCTFQDPKSTQYRTLSTGELWRIRGFEYHWFWIKKRLISNDIS